MFIKETEINNVNFSFLARNEALYILLKSNEILKYNVLEKKKEWIIKVNDTPSNIGIFNSNIYINSGFASNIISSFSGEIINKFNFKISYVFPNNEYLISTYRNNGVNITSVKDKKFCLITEKEIKLGKSIIVFNNILINTQYLNDQIIIAYNIESLDEFWKFDISSIAKFMNSRNEVSDGLVSHFLGIYNDILWLSITSGKLLGLNIMSGELVNQISFDESTSLNSYFNISIHDYIPYGELMQLDFYNQEIFGLRDKYFFRIDLRNNKLIREYYYIGNSMDSFKICSSYNNHTYPFENKYIYFCDDQQGKIGVFDRNNMEVIWSEEVEIKKNGIAQIIDMKFEMNRLIILDRNNKLHIYTKK